MVVHTRELNKILFIIKWTEGFQILSTRKARPFHIIDITFIFQAFKRNIFIISF